MKAKISRDINGNKVVKLTFPGVKARGFSIQTDGNLPLTHKSNVPCIEEIVSWVRVNGTLKQKQAINSL